MATFEYPHSAQVVIIASAIVVGFGIHFGVQFLLIYVTTNINISPQKNNL